MISKTILEQTPEVYVNRVKKMNKQYEQILESEYKSLGNPRITPDFLVDLETLSIQKMALIRKYNIQQ